jgi:Asp-tRNA(Asn)/Glu-tRNA(Gln) amidotransferase A subunit family amidase
MQLVGDLGREELLLELAAGIERELPWYDRLPDIVRADITSATGAR